jgi:hypothetical protein
VVPKYNIEVLNVDCCDLAAVEAAIDGNTKLVMIESPTNPRMQIVDIAAISKLAHTKGAKGCIVMVDNSIMAPVFQVDRRIIRDYPADYNHHYYLTDNCCYDCPTEYSYHDNPTDYVYQDCPTDNGCQDYPAEYNYHVYPTDYNYYDYPTDYSYHDYDYYACPTDNDYRDCLPDYNYHDCPTEYDYYELLSL